MKLPCVPWTRNRGALMQAAGGNLYGTTSLGGACYSCGTVFRLSPAGDFQTLYAFQEGADTGKYPVSGLVQGTDGTFYGATAGPYSR